MIIVVQDGVAGGVRCEHCKKVDTFVLKMTCIEWGDKPTRHDVIECDECGHITGVCWEIEGEYEYSLYISGYRLKGKKVEP